jgi:hypothetical protein
MDIADKLSYVELLKAQEPLTEKHGRRVNATAMSRREWTKRVTTRIAFASRLKTQPKIWLFGNEDVLRD